MGRQRSTQRRSRALARARSAASPGGGTCLINGSPAGAQRLVQLKVYQLPMQPPLSISWARAEVNVKAIAPSANAPPIRAADRDIRHALAQPKVNTTLSLERFPIRFVRFALSF